jgi:hypothetical protein
MIWESIISYSKENATQKMWEDHGDHTNMRLSDYQTAIALIPLPVCLLQNHHSKKQKGS